MRSTCSPGRRTGLACSRRLRPTSSSRCRHDAPPRVDGPPAAGQGDDGMTTSAGQAPRGARGARAPREDLRSEARALGLTDSEYDLIGAKLGRAPNGLELAVFSLMWSEHCAYKHSKKLLGRLPVEGPHLLMGPGENAGAVDVGDGLAIAFKVESHNHPSAVEPFQGAATGVGGILRDVFAIGARPIAVLDSLRFGEPSSTRSRYLLEHAVAGIGHYGNSIGVPTVGGEIYFEPAYEQNCLVNAMALGVAPHDRLTRAAASAAPRCWRAPSSARTTPPSARPSRSATRSRRRSCSSARWSCSTASC